MSGCVSDMHSNWGDDGKQQSHHLPLSPVAIPSRPFSHGKSAATSSSVPRSPARGEKLPSHTSRWKKGRLLGRGTFGHVYLGFNSETGEVCAMKEVTLFSDDPKSKECAKQLQQEISLLSRLRHPNIVRYYGSETVGDRLYIYLEYVSGGSIYKLLQEYGQFGELVIRSYTQQILSGLAYLHGKNKVHRDVKGANLLVDPSGRVKLADFGMAKHITGQAFKRIPYWMAPEVIINSDGCDLAVDIWSLGCTVLEMATTKPPWSQYEGVAAIFKIGNSKELPLIPDHLSDEGKDFVKLCLQRNSQHRHTAVQLLEHPFVKDAALERPLPNPETADIPISIPTGTRTLGAGLERNLSSLDSERLAVHSSRVSPTRPRSSEYLIPRSISSPVSLIGSPLLHPRSSQHLNGTNPRESEVAVASSGLLGSSNPTSDRCPNNLTSRSTFMNVPSHPATASVDICCLMADRGIEMELLSDADAWEVFCCQVQDVIRSPEIEPYARAICNECYGSPVIISAIGSALRAESSVEEWKLALNYLRSGDTVNINDQCFFRRHIKYCYDRLKARDVKSCFLYTALFQEDTEIDISMLVECFASEGLVSGTTTVAVYSKGLDIAGHLTNASLLEANDNGLKVKMHNVVKYSALEILSSDVQGYRVLMRLPNSEKDENQSFQESSYAFNIQFPTIHKYLTRAGAHLKESPSIQEWEQSSMIFLMDNELSSLPSKPNCSTLVALLLQRNNCLRVIPASFFDSMSALKILNLSKTRIKTLPDSFCRLSSLLILLMRDCKRLLMIPSSIGLLKSLKVLDLQGTEVTHLPDSVGELTSLEQLSVSFYGSMNHSEYKRLPSKLVSDGIILSLSLRELGIFVYPGDRRWILNASSVTKEISNLKLSVIKFHFPKVEDLQYFVHESQSWKNRSLTTFSIGVGYDFKRIVSLVSHDAEVFFSDVPRHLRFVNGENIPDAVVEVLTQATSFYLDHHLTISYLSQFGIHSFDGLKICILMDCPELIEIVNGEEQERNLFPVLEYLSINNLWKLERFWVGSIAKGSLSRLRYLSVHACPKLRYVFTCSMLDTLSNLEELVIEDCVSLQYIVIGDDDVKEIVCGDVAFVSNKDGLPMLRSLKVLKLHYLPKICGVWRGRWPLLEYISFYNCPQLRNLHMKVNDDIHIKEIAADKAWWDSLFWNDLELSRRLRKHLTQIHIDDLKEDGEAVGIYTGALGLLKPVRE